MPPDCTIFSVSWLFDKCIKVKRGKRGSPPGKCLESSLLWYLSVCLGLLTVADELTASKLPEQTKQLSQSVCFGEESAVVEVEYVFEKFVFQAFFLY